MKSTALALLLAASALGAGGCSHKGHSACGTSIEAVLERSLSTSDGEVPPAIASMTQRMGDALTKLCIDDKWTAPVLECLDDAKDPESAKACASKLTPVQLKKLNKSLGELMGVPLGDGDKPSIAPVTDSKEKSL